MTAQTWRVRFFSAALSRAGKGGVRVAYFVDKAEAEAFAATKRLYAAPAKAELVPALSAEQERVANRAAFGGGR